MGVNDYLIWRGDLPICRNYPFNEVDSLILSRLSYLPFDKVKFDGGTIYEASVKMKKLKEDDYRILDDKDLICNLGNSLRFKDFKISDFVLNKSKEIEKQFGAITIHIGRELFISYIGTDNSIVGWKEDFNLSFMKEIPAQLEGVKYLNNILSKYRGKVRIGGHSKGGNVAIYSGLYCDKKYRNRIVSITNFDGPGFDKSTFEMYGDLADRISTYIPQESVIGRLLYHKEKMIVIKSGYDGLYQHDIYSWEIIKDRIVRLDNVTDSSEFMNKTINEWLLNTTASNRKIFVDSVFELFYCSDSESFRDLSKTWTKELPKMLEVYSSIPKGDRKVIGEMVKEFGRAVSNVFKKNSQEKMMELKENIVKNKRQENG